MSASDSELSEASKTPAPPDHELEKALRREIIKAQNDEVDFSLKYIRTAAETKLGLTPGFYKSHEVWNQRSKDIIEQLHADPELQSSPLKTKAAQARQKPTKRKSNPREPAPRKRQKTAEQDEAEDTSEELSSPLSDAASDFEEEEPKKKQKKAPAKARDTKPKSATAKNSKVAKAAKSEDDEKKAEEEKENGEQSTIPADNGADGSDSELSVLLDDGPALKRKRQSKDSSAAKSKNTTSKPSTKAKPDAEDPDQAEIKRLQGWLVKCGIRKVWGKELKPFDTPRAKIKHLRDMLSDAGMTGRYSVEKASQIKEARELAADIEAVQEGAERWGAEDEEGARGEKDDDEGARPGARRLVRGAKNYDFLSSDGEETD